MQKQKHLQYLCRKYAELKGQFLIELETGNNILLLKALNGIIASLGAEIQLLKQSCGPAGR